MKKPSMVTGGHLALVLAWLGGSLAGVACSKSAPTEKPAGIAPQAPQPSSTPPQPPSAPPPPAVPAPPPVPAAEPEAMGSAPDPKQTISGTIVVPAARKKDVQKGDMLFIIARRAGGPPGPGSMLAVQKLQVGDMPMPFSLSSRDAMIPGTSFDGPISISVRVDKDGDAITRRKGDVLGQANGVPVGTHDVRISLDTLQAEDVTLGGPMGGGMGMPGGMPGGPHGGMPGGPHGGMPAGPHGATPGMPPGHP